jgi:hypothetical protein
MFENLMNKNFLWWWQWMAKTLLTL